MKIIGVRQLRQTAGGRAFERRQILVGEPVVARGSGGEFAVPGIDAKEAVVNGPENSEVRELGLQSGGQTDGLGNVRIRGDATRTLDLQVRAVPQLRLIVEL